MDLEDIGTHSTGSSDDKQTQPIDGLVLKIFIEASLIWLRTNQQTVNALNVFPVPDGDTGTNMVLTLQAAVNEIADLSENNFGKVAHALAHGALMGARGNSGVILSQLLRGFARAVDNQETLDVTSLVRALKVARDTAYKGVVRPVEGTILTVAKDIAAAAEKSARETNDLKVVLGHVVESADKSVQNTPELLPVLKEAGVVDSGGKGLFFILEGIFRHINGLSLETPLASVLPLSSIKIEETMTSIEPGQDYEVVIDFLPSQTLNVEDFYNNLDQIGTSIQLGEGDGLYRLHIHVPTENRYAPIDFTMSLGTITKVYIENLIAQMGNIKAVQQATPLALAPVEPGQIAVVAVTPGDGIARVFASLGVSALVQGGQTMNPSTQEILNSFENLPTDNIIILPNNKNIIGAAKTATELTVKNVKVVPSRSVPQGLAALMRLIPHGDFDVVFKEMSAALDEIETGEITRATRSVEIDGVKVKKGEYIAMHNGKIIFSADDLEKVCIGLLEKAHAEYFELVTLFSGTDVTKNEANRIADVIRMQFPKQSVEIHEGGQPHYHFIISIE